MSQHNTYEDKELLRQQIAEDIANFKGQIQVIPYLGDPDNKPRLNLPYIESLSFNGTRLSNEQDL